MADFDDLLNRLYADLRAAVDADEPDLIYAAASSYRSTFHAVVDARQDDFSDFAKWVDAIGDVALAIEITTELRGVADPRRELDIPEPELVRIERLEDALADLRALVDDDGGYL